MITIDQVTSGYIGGSGTFDKLIEIAKLHLIEEYNAGRINGDKYADAYISIMNNVLAQAMQFTIQAEQANKQNELTEEQRQLILQQVKSEKAKIEDYIDGVEVAGSIGKQKEVHKAQANGFRHNAMRDAAKLMTDIWSVQRSTDESIAPNDQNLLVDRNIGAAVSGMFSELGITAGSATNPTITLQVVGNTASVYGNVGDKTNTITDIKIYDEEGKSMPVVVPQKDPTTGNYGKTDIDVTLLANGILTAVIIVETSSKIPLTSNGTAIKD